MQGSMLIGCHYLERHLDISFPSASQVLDKIVCRYTIYFTVHLSNNIYIIIISIERVTIFLSKYISKGAVDMNFSTDVDNNLSIPYIQRKQNK